MCKCASTAGEAYSAKVIEFAPLLEDDQPFRVDGGEDVKQSMAGDAHITEDVEGAADSILKFGVWRSSSYALAKRPVAQDNSGRLPKPHLQLNPAQVYGAECLDSSLTAMFIFLDREQVVVLKWTDSSVIYLLPPTALVDGYQRHVHGASHNVLIDDPVEKIANRPLSLSAHYAPGLELAKAPGLCNDRYGTNYIRAFSRTATAYCDEDSTANLTCFSHQAHDTRIDSFCVGVPAAIDPSHSSIQLDCNLRNWENETAPQFQQFPTYWYATGPHAIFREYVKLGRAADLAPGSVEEAEGYSFLIKREDNHQNLWHTTMSIMSLTMSLDVLRTTTDPSTGNPFFTNLDQERSQVVFLDSLADGPFYDLWTMFAKMPSVRLSDVASPILKNTKIVVPLPGGSNPFWQGDWKELDCGESALLKTFSRRVLDFYNIPDSAPRSQRQLSLTLIDRKTKRLLIDQDAYLTALQARYPQIKMQVVDLAALPLIEQIQLIHATDILVGVHGAGLTHGMFLPPNSTIVEIFPPSLIHKGFDNMSKFLGHHYSSRHGSEHKSPDNNGDWQHDDVYVDEEDFMSLMDEAIASLMISPQAS